MLSMICLVVMATNNYVQEVIIRVINQTRLQMSHPDQWIIHVNNIISKTNRVSGLIERTLGGGGGHAPQHTKFILYL